MEVFLAISHVHYNRNPPGIQQLAYAYMPVVNHIADMST